MANRGKVATLCLMAGMFFNPFGYDALFKIALDSTGSYWTTVCIFYLVAACFFGLYFYLSGVNPIMRVWSFARKRLAGWRNW